MKLRDKSTQLLKQISSMRPFDDCFVLGAIGGSMFLYGMFWQSAGLLGGGAVVMCLSIRSFGERSRNQRGSSSTSSSAESERWHPGTAVSDRPRSPESTTTTSDALQALREAKPAGDSDRLIDEMLGVGRYVLLLRPETSIHLTPEQLRRAVRMLDEAMALVPDGKVWLGQLAEQAGSGNYPDDVDPRTFKNGLGQVAALYLDRYPVTNGEYQRFVDDHGYEQLEFWSEEALPALLGFADETGLPGPRFWSEGHYRAGEERLPVVGVSWYEACAFARWAGKRLPDDAEWTKAGAWPVESAPGRIAQRRYPWGESFDVRRANIWGAGRRKVVPVDEFQAGCSVGGIHQLIGNVWEWTATSLGQSAPQSMHVPEAMRSIRGGAFDTYFENQSTCHYLSGEMPLARRENIGFRLGVSMSVLEAAATDSPTEGVQLDPGLQQYDAEEATAC